jgi:bifunctional DNA-binding transcriptional regulator/antitoxin component of YhaV-PrlF toxin-antitoxin module
MTSSATNPLAGVMDFHYLSDMATMVLEAEASLTAQNQITIPIAIRKALKLQGGQSRVKFQILPEDGRVVVLRVESKVKNHEDAALKPFLSVLQKDMRLHPLRIVPFPAPLVDRAYSLVKGIEVDLDGPLTGED